MAVNRILDECAVAGWKIVIMGFLGVAFATAAEADVAAGKVVFVRQCAICHSVKPGEIVSAPSLAGVVGRKAGSVAKFPYSTAMKAYGRKWDAAALDTFIAMPAKAIPRTNMAFAGQPDAVKRADLIAYLLTLR